MQADTNPGTAGLHKFRLTIHQFHWDTKKQWQRAVVSDSATLISATFDQDAINTFDRVHGRPLDEMKGGILVITDYVIVSSASRLLVDQADFDCWYSITKRMPPND